MKLWLDTEFNEYLGQTISLALVSELEQAFFYEALVMHESPTPWVAKHVLPVLGVTPVELGVFQERLGSFLCQFDQVEVIADHPADIERLVALLQTGTIGEWMSVPSLTLRIATGLSGTAGTSGKPHNALADAVALRDSWMRTWANSARGV